MDSIGAITASIGALLLAMNGNQARYGWWLFLVSNIAWSVYAVQAQVYALLFQEIVYCIPAASCALNANVVAHQHHGC